MKIKIKKSEGKKVLDEIEDLELDNLKKAYDDIINDEEFIKRSGSEESFGEDMDALERAYVAAERNKDENSKKEFSRLLNNFNTKYQKYKTGNQQAQPQGQGKSTIDPGEKNIPHPLDPSKKVNRKEYFLMQQLFPLITGKELADKEDLKRFNPFVSPPAGTAVHFLAKSLKRAEALKEQEEQGKQGEQEEQGEQQKARLMRSLSTALAAAEMKKRNPLNTLRNSRPDSEGLAGVYEYLLALAVKNASKAADELAKRNIKKVQSGELNMEYPVPWSNPTLTEQQERPVIDQAFLTNLKYASDKAAAAVAVAIDKGGLDPKKYPSMTPTADDPATEEPGTEEPGTGEEPGEEQPPGEEKSDKPINVVKGKHSLQVQLTNKFGSNNKGANKFLAAIARDIKDQLSTNGINVQESIQEIFSMISSDLLLTEGQYEEISQHKELKNIIDKLKIKNGTVSGKIKGKDYPELKGAQDRKKPFYIAVNKDGEARVYSVDQQGREEAAKWAESGEANLDDIEPVGDMPEEPKEEQNYEENIKQIEKSEYAKKLDDLVKKKINNAKIKDKDFAIETLKDVAMWSAWLAKNVFGKDGNDKVISQSGMPIRELSREIGKVIERFDNNDKPGRDINRIPNIGAVKLREKIKKIIRTHFWINQRIEKEKANKTKGALARKRADQSYKDARGDEKKRVDYIKKAMKPSGSNKGSINIGKAVGQKLKAATMAINDPEQRKEFEKLVDKEKLLKAVRKFVDYAIKASGKQDQVKMVGEEKDRRSLKTILENKKPTSYRIRVLKSNG